MSRDPRPWPSPFAQGLLLGFSPMFLLGTLIFGVTLWEAITSRPETPEIIDETPLAVVPHIPPLPTLNHFTPIAGLLPAAPKVTPGPVYLGDNLACVPEIKLEASPPLPGNEWKTRKAQVSAVALHLNEKKEDGFLEALLKTRPDLAGVPFAMGASCRIVGDRAKVFKGVAEAVNRKEEGVFFTEILDVKVGEERRRQVDQTCLAVVAQVMPVKEHASQIGLVRALSSIPSPEATHLLARVAVFSSEEAVRTTAIEALAIRREEGSTEALVAGLRYPWPPIADNAATAIVRLKRKDLVPQLQMMLDAPDPRGPRTEVVAGREETVAHELVRINHLRNCLLCHAPVRRGKAPEETLVAEIPVPTQSLPETRNGYGQSDSNLLVRIDVTYLRQDFSVMQLVEDWTKADWPERQRFDFLLRKRVLTPAEATDLRRRLAEGSPYRQSAARALQELR